MRTRVVNAMHMGEDQGACKRVVIDSSHPKASVGYTVQKNACVISKAVKSTRRQEESARNTVEGNDVQSEDVQNQCISQGTSVIVMEVENDAKCRIAVSWQNHRVINVFRTEEVRDA